MAGKYGSPSVWCLVDGYDLITTKLKSLGYKIAAAHEDTTGVGDTTKESTPTGESDITVEQGQGYFDADTLGGHVALKDVADSPQEAQRVMCLGFAGHNVGEYFVGMQGAFTTEYEVLGQVGNLTKANAKHVIVGQVDDGRILHALGAETVDMNGTAVDNAAESVDGGVGYLQVKAFSGLTDAVIKIQDSPDNSVWTDLITFTTVDSAPLAERMTVAGTIDRYVRYTIDVTGTGSVSFFVGLRRN